MDRREFIVLGTASAATSLLGWSRETIVSPDLAADKKLIQATQLLNVTWDKAPCRFCGTGCGVEVAVRDNRVVALRGDENAPVNQGLLCAKGYHLPALLYGEDRLTYPQRRAADGTLTKISWDEALALVASKFSESLQQYGPESVGVYGSGQWTIFDGYAANKWVKGGLRSNNIDPNARLCMASRRGRLHDPISKR
jgi:nitrate reductase NapA